MSDTFRSYRSYRSKDDSEYSDYNEESSNSDDNSEDYDNEGDVIDDLSSMIGRMPVNDLAINLMTINVAPGSKCTKDANKRRKLVKHCIKDTKPDVILLQEVTSKINVKSAQDASKDEGVKYSQYPKVPEVAVLVKEQRFAKMERIYILDSDMKNMLEYTEIRGRVVIVKLTESEKNEGHQDGNIVYVASWHGPHKVSVPERKVFLKYLIKLMKQKSHGEPWIIGGDFNISYKNIDIEDNIAAPEHGKLDYFIYDVSEMDCCDVEFHEYDDEDWQKYLDHLPVVATVTLLE